VKSFLVSRHKVQVQLKLRAAVLSVRAKVLPFLVFLGGIT